MKEIIIYETNDGTRFDRKPDAEKYEVMASRITIAEKKYLGKRTKAVERGSAYLQHNPESINMFKKDICEIAADYIPGYKNVFLECGKGIRHISHAERVIGDYGLNALLAAFFRLSCINNETGREYSQPYYAAHPGEWEDLISKYRESQL